MTPHTIEHPYIQFTGSSGYSRNGDAVSLFADRIDNLSNEGITSGNLSLQLWACQSPYTGGELTGWKLADAPLGVLQPGHGLAPVKSDVPASFPESGDFAIALVIAEWDGEGFNLIHDFHNYPYRDVFIHPRFEGRIGYRFVDDKHLVVDVERIRNPRDPDNLSGTLSLELWALPEPYIAGDFHGHTLGAMTLGTLAGSAGWPSNAYTMTIVPPPADTYTLVLMLREWTGNGFVTRDHCNFGHQVTFPLAPSLHQAGETLSADQPGRPVTAPAESSGQTGTTSGAEGVAEPAPQSGSPTPQDTGKPPAPRTGGNSSAHNRFNDFRRSFQDLWEWIKLHW
jgi:hypothetical protein